MVKQIPEHQLFEILEAFFSGKLSKGYEGRILRQYIVEPISSKEKKKYEFNDSDKKKLKDKNLEVFQTLIKSSDNERKIIEVKEGSELIAKCHAQLKAYLRFFVQDQVLFDKNTLTFDKTFYLLNKLVSDLKNDNSKLLRITANDLHRTFKEYYPELSHIRFRIPFWEMIATLWVSYVAEIYHERKFNPRNHQAVISFTELNDFSINSIRSSFSLPDISEAQTKIKPPDERKIWYEDGVLHFANKVGGETVVDMSGAIKERKLFNAFWSLTKGMSDDAFFTREQIFKAYSKENNLTPDETMENIGGDKLGSDVYNIRKKFNKKGLKENFTCHFKKYTLEKQGYIFKLKPLL